MKKPFVFLFLILVLASTYFGLKNHFGMVTKLPKELGDHHVQKKLKEFHPLLEDQMIVAIVLGGRSSFRCGKESQLYHVSNLSSSSDHLY